MGVLENYKSGQSFKPIQFVKTRLLDVTTMTTSYTGIDLHADRRGEGRIARGRPAGLRFPLAAAAQPAGSIDGPSIRRSGLVRGASVCAAFRLNAITSFMAFIWPRRLSARSIMRSSRSSSASSFISQNHAGNEGAPKFRMRCLRHMHLAS